MMDPPKWTFHHILLLFLLLPVLPTLFDQISAQEDRRVYCNKTYGKCDCIRIGFDEVEYHCPPDRYQNGGVVMHIEDDKVHSVLIDCYRLKEEFDVDFLLPDLNQTNLTHVHVRFCPLPSTGSFKDLVEKFTSKDNLVNLMYRMGNLENDTLDKNYFVGLEKLKYLDLSSSNLSDLDENTFEDLTQLMYLNLDENRIPLGQKQGLFRNLSRLQYLTLASNRIEVIPDGLFRGLRNLTNLHLWSNDLREVGDATFEGLVNLKTLELSGNSLQKMSADTLKQLRNLELFSVARNNLTDVPEGLFKHNKNLTLARFSQNSIGELPSRLFADLPELIEIDFDSCKLRQLPSDLIQGSDYVQTIRLNNNYLMTIPDDFFKAQKNLTRLELMENLFTAVPNLKGLDKLQHLNLMGNGITELKDDDFRSLRELRRLNLAMNQIKKIHTNVWINNEKLEVLRMAYNNYSLDYQDTPIQVTPFKHLVKNLQELDLSHNDIGYMSEDFVSIKVKLREVNLSHNRIDYIEFPNLQTVSQTRVKIDLSHNKITHINFAMANTIARHNTELEKTSYVYSNDLGCRVILDDNPIQCDCELYDFVLFLRGDLHPGARILVDVTNVDDLTCASPSIYQGMALMTMPLSGLVCPMKEILNGYTGCPAMCECLWRPSDRSFVVDCSFKGLERYPDFRLPPNVTRLFSQTDLHLEGNRLTEGMPGNYSSAWSGYSNITKLNLSQNEITELAWVPPKVKVLMLDNNNLTHLPYEVLNRINRTDLEVLSVYNNPWACDCEAENFTNFLRLHAKKIVGSTNIKCTGDKSDLFLIDLNRNDLCHELPIAPLIIALMCPILIVAVLCALYYKYNQEIKVFLYAKGWCLWWVTEEELDKDKKWDCFISYSHKDEDFLSENLLPVLEPQYKLCLHYKHFVPGEHITKQIVKSVQDSRRTLVVLSPNFLESVWGKMEFRTAHTEAMSEGRARVIVVLLNDINIDTINDELKSYLKTNTYVKWGDPYFWSKLKYALPHNQHQTNIRGTNRVIRNGNKMAKAMSSLDDKFNLVSLSTSTQSPPDTPSENGTTPPVLQLDATGLLKKHPFNLIPNGNATNQAHQKTDLHENDVTPPAASEEGPLVITSSNL